MTWPRRPRRRKYEAPEYVTLRRQYQAQVRAGLSVLCVRCGRRIWEVGELQLGHDDRRPSIIRGPEHKACNEDAGRVAGKATLREDWQQNRRQPGKPPGLL